MAVQFLLEERLRENVVVTPDCPSFCDPFLLPDSSLSYTDWGSGSFLTRKYLETIIAFASIGFCAAGSKGLSPYRSAFVNACVYFEGHGKVYS